MAFAQTLKMRSDSTFVAFATYRYLVIVVARAMKAVANFTTVSVQSTHPTSIDWDAHNDVTALAISLRSVALKHMLENNCF